MSNVKANTEKPKRDKYTWLITQLNLDIMNTGYIKFIIIKHWFRTINQLFVNSYACFAPPISSSFLKNSDFTGNRTPEAWNIVQDHDHYTTLSFNFKFHRSHVLS